MNYRIPHQIRTKADRLLGKVRTDIDGSTEDRGDTVSVFNGPPPTTQVLSSETDEIAAVSLWLAEQCAAGVLPHEIGVFVRFDVQIHRATAALNEAGLAFKARRPRSYQQRLGLRQLDATGEVPRVPRNGGHGLRR